MPLHEKLLADAHVLGRYELATVLLHRNATIPWLMLVPDGEATEFLELDPALQLGLLAEARRLGEFLQSYFGSQKINFAAIGNIVPQLHLHVVGRTADDPCWPQPVWGHLSDFVEYSSATVSAVRLALQTDFGLQGLVARAS